MKRVVGIHERLPIAETIPLSLQHLMAMFGATVLVPYLVGINPAICLLMNGIGTILYTIVTKGGIPAYLGSSFAFIAPILAIAPFAAGTDTPPNANFPLAQVGFIFFGIFFVIMALIIKKFGTRWIDIVMPPAVMGAVVAVIGLELAPVAAQQAGLTGTPDGKVIAVSLITLLVTVIGSVVFRGFAQIIPVLIGVVVGYIAALFLGMVDFSGVAGAGIVGLPRATVPAIHWQSIIVIAPACLVVLAEHISHLIVTGKVTDSDLVNEPGLYRSLLGDGLSNILSGFFGSTPNTTYGENIGVMAITRIYSVWVIRGAAIIAILFSLIPKFSAFIQSIPVPVMGGVCIYLYGVIAAVGIRMLVEKRVNLGRNYNLALCAIVFSVGVSGATIHIGTVALSGMALSAVTGVVLSLAFYIFGKFGLMNEEYDPTEQLED